MATVAVATADPERRTTLRSALQSAAYTPNESTAAGELLRCVFDQPPNAIILDLALPDVDPLMLIRVLQEAVDVPLIALTGAGGDAPRARSLGRTTPPNETWQRRSSRGGCEPLCSGTRSDARAGIRASSW